ncbi:hypothetical protein [Caproiciproducens sp. CPB-2]|uniref:hypothetical protein n=1 Tax=Caproiciproducens sp. CPB-2 TaxID=3030017 RepID=UPI0023DCD9C6|nr:hypothetical protein [Caproiciproducens sp. CPB-2]MDF1493879.1 hypothetical protein [Caproiciproducens sp. CPB-2]
MITFLVISLYLVVILTDFIPVVKNGEKKITWIYSVLLAASFCVLVLYTFDIFLPGPSEAIQQIVGIFPVR